ncbi:MAG: VWA domain-containing protein [Pyrinomonadaceae bacterium]
MRKFVAVGLIVLGLFSIVSAQSGRKILTMPTPAPIVVEKEEPNYSDSAPVKTRTTNTTLRSVNTNSKPQSQTIPDNKSAEILNDSDENLKVDTSLITIPVSVFDRNGIYIPNLSQEDFKVFEDGKEQEIGYFATSEKPFTVILLLDTSPSTEYKIEEIQNAAIAFVNQLKPQDSVMVIEFAWNVHVLTDVTSDRQKIYKAIKKADFGDGTSLYDAVNNALKKRLSKIEGRKAIVLFTDGVDTTSDAATYDSTLNLAEESDVTIFPIYYNTFSDNNRRNGGIFNPFPRNGTTRSEYAVGKKYIDDLAAVTGGRVFPAESTPGGLTGAFEGIAEELRRQYNIGYYPQEAGQIGQRKQIKVRVNRPNLVIRARDSYIVAGNTNQPTTSTKPK